MVVLEERRQLGALPEQLKPVEAQPVLSEQQAPEEPLPREARAELEEVAAEPLVARQSAA